MSISRRARWATLLAAATLPLTALSGAAATHDPGTTSRVSVTSTERQGDQPSDEGLQGGPALSQSGRHVLFRSFARLVPGDDNADADLFVRDRVAGTTRLVSRDSDGAQAGCALSDAQVERGKLSTDGRFLAYQASGCRESVRDRVYRRDLQTGAVLALPTVQGDLYLADLSPDGRYLLYYVNTDGRGTYKALTLYDAVTGTGRRVAPGPSGYAGQVSAGGRYVSYTVVREGVVTVTRKDMQTGTVRWVKGLGGALPELSSSNLSLSADGRFVAFDSAAGNLVPGDTNGRHDVFVHDFGTGRTVRASLSSSGEQGDRASYPQSISDDGRYVAFTSAATQLVPGDTNDRPDAFVRDLVAGRTERVSVSSSGAQGDAGSAAPGISPDGRHVAFTSRASDLVEGDTNGVVDTFVHDLG